MRWRAAGKAGLRARQPERGSLSDRPGPLRARRAERGRSPAAGRCSPGPAVRVAAHLGGPGAAAVGGREALPDSEWHRAAANGGAAAREPERAARGGGGGGWLRRGACAAPRGRGRCVCGERPSWGGWVGGKTDTGPERRPAAAGGAGAAVRRKEASAGPLRVQPVVAALGANWGFFAAAAA